MDYFPLPYGPDNKHCSSVPYSFHAPPSSHKKDVLRGLGNEIPSWLMLNYLWPKICFKMHCIIPLFSVKYMTADSLQVCEENRRENC